MIRTAHLSICRRGVALALLLVMVADNLSAQALVEKEHRRGRLWETVLNDGWIGSLGAWDFLVPNPFGLFPGFEGYVHPLGNEFEAENTFANANMHNFRSGCWIVVKDMLIPAGPPDYKPYPIEYEVYASGLQGETYGGELKLTPLALVDNFIESSGFNPLRPEQMTDGSWYTNTGIRATRRSYVWSFPGYEDFIIYDYSFKYTGEFVSTLTGALVPNPSDVLTSQTLNEVYFVFHSGISVSTKAPINFHCELAGVHAGAFGWLRPQYHDFYHKYDDGELVFSTNYDGGDQPHPNSRIYCLKDESEWERRFGKELFAPAAFGWLALYASPLTGQTERTTPKPDVLRIDSHKGGTLGGQPLDLQGFYPGSRPKKLFHVFATTPDTQAALGNIGDRLNFYTLSYGPYTLAPGDSVRFIIAEIAGVMDYNLVNAGLGGGVNGFFRDSAIVAIQRNAENARNAVKWGLGATVDGIPLAADAPDPPPGPTCDAINASIGPDTAAIGVTWDRLAETTIIRDGSGGVFYDGINDLDGYRIYRSTDFQFTTDAAPPVFRGAAWSLLVDIPKAEFMKYFDSATNKYNYLDRGVSFGFQYGYYVSAYRKQPKPWTSANGMVVSNLPELASGSYNRSLPASALPGPIPPNDPSFFDIFVAPNPFVYNDPDRSFGLANLKIEFRNLPERCTIRIYTVMGDLLKTVEHQPDERGNVSGSEAWDQKSESGLVVAPGLYIYHIESKMPGIDRSLTGKLMIVR